MVVASGGVFAAPKQPTSRSRWSYAPLVTAMTDPDAEVAARAVTALGDADQPAAHDALLDALAFGVPAPVAGERRSTAARAAPRARRRRRDRALRRPPRSRQVREAAVADRARHVPGPGRARRPWSPRLHDPAGVVRASAAAAAAKGHNRGAIDPLFELLARGEDPAVKALAQMADPDLAAKIADHLGQVPDAALAKCLGAILVRPDFGPDPARVEVVRALTKIQDNAATNALADYVEATPKNPPRPSRAEAERAFDARRGGGK